MNEDEVLAYIRAQIGSVYTLELLLLLKQSSGKQWTTGDLVQALRSSNTAVAQGLRRLMQSGIVSEEPAGRYFFAPSSPELQNLVSEIEHIYAVKPISVVKAIIAVPNDKLQAFSDAFKLRE